MNDLFLEEEEDEQEDDRQVTVKRSDLKALQRTARDGKKAQDKLAQLDRENAFYRAGIPVGDKRASYFIKGYDGESTPEAIRAAWDEDFGAQSSPVAQGTDPAEAAALQRVSDASTGAEPTNNTLTAEMFANAQTPEEVERLAREAGIWHIRE